MRRRRRCRQAVYIAKRLKDRPPQQYSNRLDGTGAIHKERSTGVLHRSRASRMQK